MAFSWRASGAWNGGLRGLDQLGCIFQRCCDRLLYPLPINNDDDRGDRHVRQQKLEPRIIQLGTNIENHMSISLVQSRCNNPIAICWWTGDRDRDVQAKGILI